MNVTLRNQTLIFVMVILLQILTLDNAPEPDILDDKTSEMQSDTASNSTNFTSSGGSGLVISGEPAYVGDTLTASLMVTNKGNSSGSVSLQINIPTANKYFRANISLFPPAQPERSLPASFWRLPGTNEFNWQLSVLGQTGHTDLEGNLSIEVSNSQILNLTTDSISWSASEGLEIDVSVFLSEGKARPILLAVASEEAGGAVNLQEILLEANPGRRVIDFSLGNPETTEITIQAIPVQWTPSIFSQNVTIESVAAPHIDPSSIKLEAIFNPEKPTPGSRVLVTITLSNDNDHITQSGILRLISSFGENDSRRIYSPIFNARIGRNNGNVNS